MGTRTFHTDIKQRLVIDASRFFSHILGVQHYYFYSPLSSNGPIASHLFSRRTHSARRWTQSYCLQQHFNCQSSLRSNSRYVQKLSIRKRGYKIKIILSSVFVFRPGTAKQRVKRNQQMEVRSYSLTFPLEETRLFSVIKRQKFKTKVLEKKFLIVLVINVEGNGSTRFIKIKRVSGYYPRISVSLTQKVHQNRRAHSLKLFQCAHIPYLHLLFFDWEHWIKELNTDICHKIERNIWQSSDRKQLFMAWFIL